MPADDGSTVVCDSSLNECKLERTPFGFLALIFLFLLIAQLGLYWQSFHVKPSGDDFSPPLADIHRGEREGPVSLLRSSQIWNFRPLDSLTVWAFGRNSLDRETIYIWIRVLHFLSYMFYALVAFMWIKLLNLSKGGAFVAGVIIFMHPVMTGPLASVDGSSRILVGAFIWLGGYFVFRFINKSLIISSILSTICFLLAMGFMEYAVALIPLGVVTAFMRSTQTRIKNILWVLIPMLTVFLVFLLMRVYVAEQGVKFTSYLSLNPFVWVKNFLIMCAGLLFFGNTVWVKINSKPEACIWFLINILIVTGLIYYGLRQLWRDAKSKTAVIHTGDSLDFSDISGKLRFLLSAIVISSTPMVFMMKVSEVYLSPLVIPFALLAGFSVPGWCNTSRIQRGVASLLILFQLCIAIPAIHSKIGNLIEVGQRTEALAMDIVSHIPSDTRELAIAIVFNKTRIYQNRHKFYSNFKRDDYQLIYPPNVRFAMDWFCPGEKHRLLHIFTDDLSEIDYQDYDLVLVWDSAEGRFIPLAGLTETCLLQDWTQNHGSE